MDPNEPSGSNAPDANVTVDVSGVLAISVSALMIDNLVDENSLPGNDVGKIDKRLPYKQAIQMLEATDGPGSGFYTNKRNFNGLKEVKIAKI